jgi:uncharacterized protein (DUF1810 family)
LTDPFELARFVAAQDGVYDQALDELRHGHKRGHWMWFVFPQLAGLGFSAMSRRYAISGLDEARAYLAHPVLGPRLRECAAAVGACPSDPRTIFGSVDEQKLRSSMTLFLRAAPDEPVFAEVLDRQFSGVADERTDELLG